MAEYFWNDFDLQSPPLSTVPVKNTIFAKNVFSAVNEFLHILVEPKAEEFKHSAALLSRLIARRKSSFRHMIGFRYVEMLNTALCRLLRLDLPRDLEALRSALPDIYDDSVAGNLPTQNYLDFVLIRVISAYHIHQRIQDCCKRAGKCFVRMLASAHFLEFNTLLIAVIAKIASLSKWFQCCCSRLYNGIIQHRQRFPNVNKHAFLPDGFQLPIRLGFDVATEQQEVETAVVDKTVVQAVKTPKAKAKPGVDLGTAVERQSPLNSSRTENAFSVDKLTTVEKIKMFIASENQRRQKRPNDCVTENIQHHEWAGVQKLFQRKVKEGHSAKAISLFSKFISRNVS